MESRDGIVESLNQTLKNKLNSSLQGMEWEELLPEAIHAINRSPNSATGETPSFMEFGVSEKIRVTNALTIPKSDIRNCSKRSERKS